MKEPKKKERLKFTLAEIRDESEIEEAVDRLLTALGFHKEKEDQQSDGDEANETRNSLNRKKTRPVD